MANFKTHLFVAAGLSGVAALACAKAGVAPSRDIPTLFGLGTLGGLLPDIDSEKSIPLRIAFYLLAVGLAFVTMLRFVGNHSVLELAVIWLAVFAGVRYVILELFMAYTIHRGSFHSLLAVVLFTLGATSLVYHLGGQARGTAWLYGSFIGFGYLVHLTLDEIFSVDLLNRRIKRSFGTALKPFSLKYWRSSMVMTLAVMLVSMTVPSPAGFYRQAWTKLEARQEGAQPWLIPPVGAWFDRLDKWLDRDRKPVTPAQP